jgi:hypothetical protein
MIQSVDRNVIGKLKNIGRTGILCLLVTACSPEPAEPVQNHARQITPAKTNRDQSDEITELDITNEIVPGKKDVSGYQIVKNEEYGIEAIYPADVNVCYTQSGGHPHGFYVRYGGREPYDCHASEIKAGDKASAYGVWADYNSGYKTDGMSYLSDCTHNAPTRPGKVSVLKGLEWPAQFRWNCMVKKLDGSIEITLVAPSGHTSDGANGPDVPAAFYSVWLTTYPGRYEEDMHKFRDFVSKVRLEFPGFNG